MPVGINKTVHKRIRKGQRLNDDAYHHPQEKIAQLKKFEQLFRNKSILEVFGGSGNLTKFYTGLSPFVDSMTKETHGDSFRVIYEKRFSKRKYDVIDIDSYGYPDKFFPIVFELMEDTCLLIFTFPIVGVNPLNGIMEQHFMTYWRSSRPTIGDVVGVLTDMALREWFMLSLMDVRKIERIYRFIFRCRKQKATEFCGVRNR